jgi:hypothetical protein
LNKHRALATVMVHPIFESLDTAVSAASSRNAPASFFGKESSVSFESASTGVLGNVYE